MDRFLIVFMLILYAYMLYSLLTGKPLSGDSNTVDVIVRTSAAAIFGYFISSNFASGRGYIYDTYDTGSNIGVGAGTEQNSAAISSGTTVERQIGFHVSSENTDVEPGQITYRENAITDTKKSCKLQVMIVAVIGLISLAILLIARNFQHDAPEVTAIVSQLRDFVSACIGFLISCGKTATD